MIKPGALRWLQGALVVATALLLANAATAQNYGTFNGTNIDFEDVTETSSTGDPPGQYGAPIVIGDQLLFFPASYDATAGGGAFDLTGTQLQAALQATTGTLTTVTITEFGDTTIGGTGTAATGTFAGIGGAITVLEANGVPIAPVIIPIPVDDIFFTLPSDPGITNWSLTTTVDIGAVVPNATRAFLSFDNNLQAFSETDSSAAIQKKVVSGPAIVISVPEPTMAALVVLAALGVAVRRRA